MDTEAELTQRGHSSPGQGEGRPRFAFPAWPGLTWRRAGVLGVLCTVFLLLLSNFVVQPFLIPSRSMEPTLEVGDRVLVNKLAYRFGDQPQRGDVVVFDGTGSFVREGADGNPVGEALHGAASALGLAEPSDTDFVKRVVGVGGDDVVCCDAGGRIEVNGVAVDEPYLYPGDSPSKVPFRIVVPLGTLWVMGDHRSQSRDSRDHLGEPGGGMVPVDKVIGRADWIGWPVSRWGSTGTAPGSGPGAVGGGHG
ncbi:MULTISPECIES: signal peptidase I [unclassified Streptomyces]|uniref:signal peptidase I n=1 Tax=unclassified Streptomyces TaxID=2593676 RepID=UPI001BE5666D|nr:MULTISPECIES: signal peptidase I [unclassified Streptomyces]MBT2406062.1 signal peptidase I [Streptomyces sp. ISL-21]MBT2453533.1 signal peptidase I [Streptomyces sp. ISL-86]MBT2610664.1 signal peptidase I [Streptomyces sp. ISL-87]